MLLEEESLKLMGQGLGWPQGDIDSFIGFHYKAITQLIQRTALKHIASHDPDRLKEINELVESNEKEKIIKGFKAVQDQIELELITYPDLKAELDQYLKDYEEEVLFKYLETAEVNSVLELLKYMKSKLVKYEKYIEIYEAAKKRAGDSRVKEVLGEI